MEIKKNPSSGSHICPPCPHRHNNNAATAAIIVSASIILLVLIATVTYYLTVDPYENAHEGLPANEKKRGYYRGGSLLGKKYYKEQLNWFAYGHTHQTPRILMHFQAAFGQLKDGSPNPINTLNSLVLSGLSDMIGVTRLKRRGQIKNALDVARPWIEHGFFATVNPEENEFPIATLIMIQGVSSVRSISLIKIHNLSLDDQKKEISLSFVFLHNRVSSDPNAEFLNVELLVYHPQWAVEHLSR